MELANASADARSMTTGDDETATPPTKQQKLIKAALLLGLALVIVYVILDYTVSQRSNHLLLRSPLALSSDYSPRVWYMSAGQLVRVQRHVAEEA